MSLYEQVINIWNSFQDEKSKHFFTAGLYAQFDRNYKPLYEYLISINTNKSNFIYFLANNYLNNYDIFIYGFKNYTNIKKILYDFNIATNNIIQDGGAIPPNVENLNIFTLEQFLLNIRKNTIVIIPDDSFTRHEKKQRLLNKGVSENQIILVIDIDEWQYFDPEVIQPNSNEIFIDAGAYDGKTTLKFVEWCNGQYDKIYTIEPDRNNFLDCVNTIETQKISNCEIINAAVWSEDTYLNFSHIGGPGARINSNSINNVKTLSIDGILNGKGATFIKYDVEGAELAALKGTQNTIQTHRPHLAVSIYHKPQDLFDIPNYLLQLIPDYKFYIRHYSTYYWEMVLHAI